MNHRLSLSEKMTKLFLRICISVGLLSAVTDRLGGWPVEVSAWGNWESFLAYTQVLNPWVPVVFIPGVGWIATVLEVVFAISLLAGFKTELVARLAGFLLLLFALSMTFFTGIKGALDYSVFMASAASFALSTQNGKFLEVDQLWGQSKNG